MVMVCVEYVYVIAEVGGRQIKGFRDREYEGSRGPNRGVAGFSAIVVQRVGEL
jgi:hypothetical protein